MRIALYAYKYAIFFYVEMRWLNHDHEIAARNTEITELWSWVKAGLGFCTVLLLLLQSTVKLETGILNIVLPSRTRRCDRCLFKEALWVYLIQNALHPIHHQTTPYTSAPWTSHCGLIWLGTTLQLTGLFWSLRSFSEWQMTFYLPRERCCLKCARQSNGK